MASETAFNATEIRNCADRIGALLDDMGSFTKLKGQHPNAGNFALAQWLERIVDDRRNGVVAHAEHLNIVFNSMQSTLRTVADDFENADGDNADAIVKVIGELESKVTSDITTMDENTENQQHNFSGGDDKNNKDGDGYNDDVTADFPANS